MTETEKRRKASHVVTKSGTLEVCCLHCGASWLPALPMGIDQYVGMGKAFLRAHRACLPGSASLRQGWPKSGVAP